MASNCVLKIGVITMHLKLFPRATLAVAIAGFLLMGALGAEAKTHIHLWIGVPGFPYWDGPGYYGDVYRRRLSCSEGRRILGHRGYSSIRALDCSPRYYRYSVRKYTRRYVVRLDSLTGRIVQVRRG
jgi:hypothetical protein